MKIPLFLTLLTLVNGPAAAIPVAPDLSYGGANFRALAAESYKIAGLKGDFTAWLADAYAGAGLPLAGGKTLDAALKARKAELESAKTPTAKDALARDTAAWAHRFIKKVVPKFSLERGYEFASIVKTGERQCLLQSTIMTALLQKAGLDAGLVMVWKSMSGQESNLGHVTSVLRLPSTTLNGTALAEGTGDLQVDASEPQPFATHQGILAWTGGGYHFLTPQFGPDGLMTAYTRLDNQQQIKPADLAFLSLNYIRSQYSYYRAERAIGGVLGTGSGKSTPAGLKTSENYLRLALRQEPNNALAASVLGSTLRKEGQDAAAREQYRKAAALYTAQGHLPASITSNLAWANAQGQ